MTIGIRDAFTGTAGADSRTLEADATFSATATVVNRYTGERVPVAGLNRSFDTYDLGRGSDTLRGTAGDDALLHSTAGSARTDDNGTNVASAAHFAGVETFHLGAGDDVLDLTAGAGGAGTYASATRATGDSTAALSSGALGDDVIWGVSGNVYGDTSGTMSGTAVGGDDNLHAGPAAAFLRGDAISISGTGAGGADTLRGGAGGDTLYGEANTVSGTATCGGDYLNGGAGGDTLFGDAGNFTSHTGARGADTFDFDTGGGQDTIGDFQHGVDTIRIDPAYGFDDFADLAITGATDAVIALNGTTDQITLTGVSAATLDAGDFEFIA